MKLTRKHGALALLAVCGIIAVVVASYLLLMASWWFGFGQGRLARPIIQEWGRLAPFPEAAEPVKLEVKGNPFARSFRARFRAPGEEIERWLGASPGTGDAMLERTPTTRHYEIKPGGGAQHAEVNVDDARHEVSIYVCWS